MKTLILSLALFTSTSAIFAQTIERQVVASAGTTLSNATTQLDFTVGELQLLPLQTVQIH